MLLDIDTLEIDAAELLSNLRRDGFRIPVLAVTGPVTSFDASFEPVVANGYLRKPLVPTSIRRALREVCLQKWVDEHNVLLDQYTVLPSDRQATLRSLTGASVTGPLAG